MARVLVVDDDESDRQLHEAILELHGHEVFTAAGGEEGLREYDDKDIEVVVTDLQMLQGHGFELITALRDRSPRPAIIAVSGTGPEQLQMAHELGAHFTLHKPVDPQRLLTAVEQVLAARAAMNRQREGEA